MAISQSRPSIERRETSDRTDVNSFDRTADDCISESSVDGCVGADDNRNYSEVGAENRIHRANEYALTLHLSKHTARFPAVHEPVRGMLQRVPFERSLKWNLLPRGFLFRQSPREKW